MRTRVSRGGGEPRVVGCRRSKLAAGLRRARVGDCPREQYLRSRFSRVVSYEATEPNLHRILQVKDDELVSHHKIHLYRNREGRTFFDVSNSMVLAHDSCRGRRHGSQSKVVRKAVEECLLRLVKQVPRVQYRMVRLPLESISISQIAHSLGHTFMTTWRPLSASTLGANSDPR